MESCGTSDRIKNICAIVEERDNILLQKEIKIKYYKNAIKEVEKEIAQLEKESKEIDEENAFLDQILEFQEVIKESLKLSQEVTLESLHNHQILQDIYDKERETMEKESRRVEQDCQQIYSETKEMLHQHPLYQEMEKAEAEYLKIDIIKRQQDVKIRERKRIQKQRLKIDKQLFYNFYIEMAENYVLEKKTEELKEIKRKEMEGLKVLYELQQQLVLKQKLGTPSEGLKKLTNLTFGSQEQKTERKVEQGEPKKETMMSSSEKLSSMFASQNEQQMEVFAAPQPPTLPKVQVISNTIISAPSALQPSIFVAPKDNSASPTLQPSTFVAPPEKRKSKTFVMKRKWQKLMKTSNNSMNESMSQESEKNFSSQPRLSQNSQQQLDKITQQQITDTPQQPLTQISQQKSQSSHVSSSQLSGHSVLTSTSTLNENTPKTSTGGILLNASVSANDFLTKSNKPLVVSNQQPERGSKGVSESTKSVRFNLEGIDQRQRKQKQHLEPESIFGNSGPSIFSNAFSSFRNDYANMSQGPDTGFGPFNTSYNMPLMEQTGTNFNAGLQFNSGETQQLISKSPDFSYEMEQGADQQSFKATEISSFGGGSVGGGFFSFPKFNPF